jgi:hypothetical protein
MSVLTLEKSLTNALSVPKALEVQAIYEDTNVHTLEKNLSNAFIVARHSANLRIDRNMSALTQLKSP